ncbi:hypothetical protein [Gordonia sp. NB41Y]|uniref:hypothetical protein n=1 Tax=Gordonia sp. NB41Y TaxID=875808 RepID=UPI0002BDF80F|nr:hypothetical protein [Gordonia sp. NB41Y]EMP10001.1 hypothetical protein ISGA_3317 [Gordonia sp. NB41Y]WLP90274.1 hypothetical protein Q9K23_22615 [Gordonia sp. NB41Y]
MTDRDVLDAAGRELRRRARRRQADEMLADGGRWSPPDPVLEALAVECDDAIYGRGEAADLTDRLAEVLGDGWEP